uniref:Vav guanine nucleotide exchange factor 1 n=1 Tax=Oncorhynchus mykiss TaxID=8022 RepID=A0A8K9XGQ4_ONCMY
MELWRHCAVWLIECRVLPESHRVTWDSAQVCELAQALRDGVLLCQLLNNLLPHAINLREINLRPQMSQFLCLKNIRTFLGVCQEKFHLRKTELFEAFDLFDVRDFGKVCVCVETVDEDDDLYDCVEDEENEGDEIYEDLMRADEPSEMVREDNGQYYQRCVNSATLFSHLKDGGAVFTLGNGHFMVVYWFCYGFVIVVYWFSYGCRANSGRFSLRDLLMVPMQRVLKYHLLLQELVKHTSSNTEKENLRTALDAMRDLAQCVNEVKRDNEIIKQITTFQLSIENMTQSLALYGRPKIDGELKISSSEKKSKQDRYAFLFDKAMLVCKKKSGETMELKEIIDLQYYQLRDETTGEKDSKKWSHFFLLIDYYGKTGYNLFFKTRDLKKKWLEQFEMALSNMCPENCTANSHDFQMHCFEDTTSCKACSMLLRGIFFQGYRCSRCRMAAHKECLGRVPGCGRNSGRTTKVCLPTMEVCQEYYGLPPPPVAFGQPLHLSMGDVIELTRADADLTWWELLIAIMGKVLYCSNATAMGSRFGHLSDLGSRFAGNMDRSAAKNLLISRSDGTFLVRQKDGGEFAISLKFNMDIRHIKITSTEGLYRINEKKAFKGLIEMVQFYQQHSLKEYFKDVDTTLQTPFNQPDQSDTPFNTPSPGGSMRSFGTARARYDFSARDRTELSLREGDTVKVLSKKAHNGWWKGEVYGRVGLFPANYVEEDYSDYC